MVVRTADQTAATGGAMSQMTVKMTCSAHMQTMAQISTDMAVVFAGIHSKKAAMMTAPIASAVSFV